VLHQGDLTYTVVTSGVAGDRMQAYQTICQFLIQGWRQLGVELSYGAAGRGYIHNPNCFGTATAADLVTPDGTKLIGSAQLRRGSAVLQHGSMRLYPDLQLFEQVFGAVIQPPQLPLNFSEERAIATLSAAASQCFAAELHTEPLSATEWQAIQEFIKPAVLQQNPPKSE
jgi:lipoate-protein ligase A